MKKLQFIEERPSVKLYFLHAPNNYLRKKKNKQSWLNK